MFSSEELNTFFRYCIVLTNNDDSASDLLQSCLEKYVKLNPSGINDIKAYFRRMIRNQFIDDQRKDDIQQLYEFDEESTVVQIDMKYLDDIIVNREQTELILSMLNPHEREVLFLWAVEGFTVKEIACDLGIPIGTLLSKLHRVKLKIKNQLCARRKKRTK